MSWQRGAIRYPGVVTQYYLNRVSPSATRRGFSLRLDVQWRVWGLGFYAYGGWVNTALADHADHGGGFVGELTFRLGPFRAEVSV